MKKFDLYELTQRECKETVAGQTICRCTCVYANCGGDAQADKGVEFFQLGRLSIFNEPLC